jgi:hypothetical protein
MNLQVADVVRLGSVRSDQPEGVADVAVAAGALVNSSALAAA